MDPASFSKTYAEARERFLAAAQSRRLAVESNVLPELRGADGEMLAMDVALAGDASAPGLLVLWSATHGVEGHCGSGCQTAFLRDDGFMRAVDDAGAAVLFVHALNPHGFSYGRRANEDNVDLNRNFRDFDAPAPVNAAYAEIHELLLPAAWPPPQASEAQLGAWIVEHGEAAFQAAVSGGQYRYPDGLFYGGTKATWSNRTLRAVMKRHASKRERLAVIDFHTGLGPRGHGEKIYNGRAHAADMERTREWWGKDVTSFLDGTASSAPLVGINGGAISEECPGVPYASIALEYGTLPLREMLGVLRADHWLYNHPEAPASVRDAIRRQVRDAFYIDADDWKAQVLAQALSAARTALERLARSR
jgi:hypothetical protein